METLASVWACDPRDLSDLGEKSSVWEPQSVFHSSAPAALMWTEQLSPHLQRNQQLQDTLLQREEELLRLQDENHTLREFLSSSFVRNLEQKAKKLTADGRRKLKRSLMHADDGPFQNRKTQLLTSQQVSKRVCRNLAAEFGCETPSSEPNLDLWVLRTLGLKDRDTIDTSNESSPGYSLSGLVYDAAVTSCSEYSLNSSFSPSDTTSTPSSVLSYCQTPTQRTDYSAECREAHRGISAESPQSCTTSPGQRSDFIASSRVQTLAGNSAKHPAYWSPPQDAIRLSPPGQRVPLSAIASSSPVMTQLWTPVPGGSTSSASAGSLPPAAPRSRTDLAFSMSLSPSSSVKTHSFPQGQAFVRKDTEGRWNFTWVPSHGP
ncbi:geminin coiled-coil domain-containing protein 1 [Cottoperca gobio]|uniref:Geminin coiled-coil domain-containing protein 1 n=1 Tax=Cottoperca gobio TaxID=56716 RepID=A0A6J2PE71_COTGO|nr:geminin coiled-coil domain-containing protein 1 [Cottoperca gobio]